MLQNTICKSEVVDLSSAPWTMQEFFAGSGLVAYGLKGMFALSLPSAPIARDEMDTAAFDTTMTEGLAQAKAGQGLPLEEAVQQLAK